MPRPKPNTLTAAKWNSRWDKKKGSTFEKFSKRSIEFEIRANYPQYVQEWLENDLDREFPDIEIVDWEIWIGYADDPECGRVTLNLIVLHPLTGERIDLPFGL